MTGHIYSDGKGEWLVSRLWDLAAGLPVQEIDPEAFHEWEDMHPWPPMETLGDLAGHMRDILDADLSYPVIVSADGNVMDGCHRIVKAWLEGRMVKMVRFTETPEPDRIL